MLGFVELFLAWLPIAMWDAWLSRRPDAPRAAGKVTWTVGIGLGLCLAFGTYALVHAVGGITPTHEPTVPSAAPAIGAMTWAQGAAHLFVGGGYVAMVALTGSWVVTRR